VIVNITIQNNFTQAPIWNVVAKVGLFGSLRASADAAQIEGWEDPDRWVVMGAHRDAWVFGAVDPVSASAVLTEACSLHAVPLLCAADVVRAQVAGVLGELQRRGWQPRRTIVIVRHARTRDSRSPRGR
jgi:hypothetical protein